MGLIALFVLLYGQPVTRVVRLRIEDVLIDGDRTAVRFSADHVDVPEPAATLLRALIDDPRHRRNTAANQDSPWLFPGQMPGRPMHAVRAGQAIGAHGIPPRAALTATWQQLVRQAPPSVLARALGISPVTAMRHANRAGTDYLAYPSLKGCR